MAKTKKQVSEKPKKIEGSNVEENSSVLASSEVVPEKTKERALSPYQIRTIENRMSEVTTARLEMSVNEQYLRNLELQIQNLQLHLEKQKLVLEAKASAYEDAKLRYNEVSKQIFASHGITEGNIGYDPESGIITV